MTPESALHATTWKPRRVPVWLAGALGAIAVGTVLGLTLELPLLALGVPLVAAAAWALFQLPLKVSATGVMLSAFFFEGLQAPLAHDYESVFMPFARLMLANLNFVTGVGFLRMPLIDLLTVVLCVAAVVRRRDRTFVSKTAGVRPLNVALLVSALTVVGLDVLGTVQGGNFNESLWQLRHSLMFPLRALLLIRAFDGTDVELKTLTKVIIAAGVAKALVGIVYLYGYVYPHGWDVEFTTSHTDTLLWVPMLALYFNLLVEKFRLRLLADGLVWVPIVAFGMACNDRRLAYVCLGIAAVATLLLTPPTRFKRLILRVCVLAAPLVPPYLLLGWSSTGGRLFWGARLVKSLVIGDPNQGNQADYRDLENVNVLVTWAQNAIVPAGFGHKFALFFPLPDISKAMPTWQYHPHNQYLWFMAIAGPIGFTLIMLPQLVTLYLCARTYRMSNELWVRVWCLTGIAIVASFFCQMWGDMGTLSWTPSWMAALAAAVASKLAVRTGAWPVSAARPR